MPLFYFQHQAPPSSFFLFTFYNSLFFLFISATVSSNVSSPGHGGINVVAEEKSSRTAKLIQLQSVFFAKRGTAGHAYCAWPHPIRHPRYTMRLWMSQLFGDGGKQPSASHPTRLFFPLSFQERNTLSLSKTSSWLWQRRIRVHDSHNSMQLASTSNQSFQLWSPRWMNLLTAAEVKGHITPAAYRDCVAGKSRASLNM